MRDLQSFSAVRVDERHVSADLDPADLYSLTGEQRRNLNGRQSPATDTAPNAYTVDQKKNYHHCPLIRDIAGS